MRLGKGIRQRTPIRCWLASVLLGAIVLPGAAATVAVHDESSERSRLPNISATSEDLVGSLPGELRQDQPALAVHPIGDLLGKLRDARIAEGHTPESVLIGCITPLANRPGGTPNQKLKPTEYTSEDGTTLKFGEGKETVQLIGEDQLVVYATGQQHESIGRLLSQFREHGFRQFIAEVHFVSMEPNSLNQLQIDWEIGELPTADDSPNSSVIAASGTSTFKKSMSETIQPVLFATLNDEQQQELFEAAKRSIRANIVQAPTVTVFNGQQAIIKDGAERPFVTGVKRTSTADSREVLEPVTQIVQEGTRMMLNPNVDGDEILLQCELSFQAIHEIKEKSFRVKGQTHIVTVQVPKIAKTELRTSQKLANGSSLAIRCEWPTEVRQDGKVVRKDQHGFVLVSCRLVDELAPPVRNASGHRNPLGRAGSDF